MDIETKQLLTENIQIAKENNQMLHSLVRAQKIANIYRIIYWSIIIFSTFGLYYFIQPFLENMFSVYTGGTSGSNNVSDVLNGLDNKQQVKDLLNSIK